MDVFWFGKLDFMTMGAPSYSLYVGVCVCVLGGE